MIYIIVGLAGVIGALIRYYLGIVIVSTSGIATFPIGTLIINYIGAFILGGFNEFVSTRKTIPETVRLGVGTGLIGSFTTFSTFSVEVVQRLNEGLWLISFSYISLSMIGGLAFAFLGNFLAHNQFTKRVNEEGQA